jgi:ATP phosphoribosyltransferase
MAMSEEKTLVSRALRIAVPKGALYEESVEILRRAELDTTGLDDPGRQLVIYRDDIEYLILRPTDIPVFVAYGGADCAICGKDSIVESALDVVELVDLKFGSCRFVVAEPEFPHEDVQETYERLGVLRVATKYPHITEAYYAAEGTQVDIIKLHGNIELAPLCGMAERILDITATGTTLRENHLRIIDDVLNSTARFIGNPAAVRIDKRVRSLASALLRSVCENNDEEKKCLRPSF